MTEANDDIELRRSSELLTASRSRLLIVDVQEKLLPVISDGAHVQASCLYLMQAANTMNVPVHVSEQYPQGLGGTIPELTSDDIEHTTFEKIRFSAAEGFRHAVAKNQDRDQIVIAGIEAHICVLQTALDLLASGFRVYVVADATGSRKINDVPVALNRIRDAGGVVISSESVAFEWCEAAGTDEFRKISRMTRERSGK